MDKKCKRNAFILNIYYLITYIFHMSVYCHFLINLMHPSYTTIIKKKKNLTLNFSTVVYVRGIMYFYTNMYNNLHCYISCREQYPILFYLYIPDTFYLLKSPVYSNGKACLG